MIYAKTLRAMNWSIMNLTPTDTTFHRIVPGKAKIPLGKVHLDVVFGSKSNFRRENMEFEVMDWPSQYHAILGRPTFARFMVVPHYAYLVLKMPAPNGVITVKGSFSRADSCDREFNEISKSFGMEAELGQLKLADESQHTKGTPARTKHRKSKHAAALQKATYAASNNGPT